MKSEPVSGTDAAAPSPLKRLGKYEIERKLGQGGMGAVYLATDATLKRKVALKVLPKDKAENPTLVRRFQAEAQAAAQLRHDNIVAVFDSGSADGYLYIAMEYVDGTDLHEHVSRRGIIPVKRSIELIKQAASALQHAYEHKIVHRDIKPSNLLLRRDGVLKLTDLGLARSVDDTIETNITRAGTTVGTVDYMAPEQARNSKLADIRSDLYSLGCTWYFMLTGQPPYPDGSLTNKLQAHAIKPLPNPQDQNKNVSEGLVAVLHRMIAKKPEDRYQTPKELLDDLKTAVMTSGAVSRTIFDEPPEAEEAPRRSRGEPAADEGAPARHWKRLPDSTEDDDSAPTTGSRRTRSSSPEPVEDDRPADKRHWKSLKKEELADDEAIPASPGSRSRSSSSAADDAEAPVDKRHWKSLKKDEVPDDAGGPSSSPSSSRTGGGSSPSAGKTERTFLPPPTRPAESDREESPGINLDWLKMPLAIAAAIAAVGGLGWMISSYSGSMGGFGTTPPPANVDPFGKTVPGPGTVAVAPVGGGPGGAPMVDGSVQVANVYGGTPGTTPDGAPANPNATNTSGNPGSETGTGTSVATPNGTGVNPLTPGGAQGNEPFEAEKLPKWATADDARPKATLTVGPGPSSLTHAPTLSEALSRLGPSGGVLQLLGTGPFTLTTPQSLTVKRLVLLGDEKTPPVLFMGSAGEGLIGSLTVRGGNLELNGIHVTIDRTNWKTKDPQRLFSVIDGHLLLRNGSVSLTGPSAELTKVFSLEGTVPGGARLLIEQMLLRGETETWLDVRTNQLDAVVHNSLLATGQGTVLKLAGHSAVTATVKGRPARVLRSLHSTWVSPRAILDLSADATRETPLPTQFVWLDSVCAAAANAGPRLLVNADGWLQEPLRQSVTWTSLGSAYLGFENLLDFGDKSSFRARNADGWRIFWQEKIDADQFQSDVWPSAITDWNQLDPTDFDPSLLSPAVKKIARQGEVPGVDPAHFTIPEASHPARLAAFSRRRPLPPAATQSIQVKNARRIDLKKEDLGAVLARGDWPNGTIFEAVGSGNCLMSPVQLAKRQVKIVFRQSSEAAPIKLIPKDAGKDVEALIRIENGSLEIEDLRWASPEPRPTLPAWLIAAHDAHVVLRRCELVGPEKATVPYAGVIRFTTAPQPASEPPTLSVLDSFIQAPGTLIRAEAGPGTLFVRNSVLAARGIAIDVRPRAINNDLPFALDLVQTSIAATESGIQFTAVSLKEPAKLPVQAFVEGCAFTPPFTIRAGEATAPAVVRLQGPVLEQQQVAWWGRSNGVSREVRVLLAKGDNIFDPKAWQAAWGEGHDAHLLSGPDGVVLADHLPVRKEQLKPGSFALHSSCKGVVWAEGRPVGADVRQLDGLGPQKVADAVPAGGTKKPNTKVGPIGPKNPGGF